MTDNFIRHFCSVVGTLIGLIIYFAGYIMGGHGWWWAGLAVFGIYPIVYSIITAGKGH